MKIRLRMACGWLARQLRPLQPFLASFVMHALGLVVLSLMLFPMVSGSAFHSVFLEHQSASDALEDPANLPAPIFASASSAADRDAALDSRPESLEAEFDGQAFLEAIDLKHLDAPRATLEPERSADDSAANRGQPDVNKRWGTTPRETSTNAEVREAGNPGAALSAVTSAIQRELEQADTLVVWLVDASISLEEDRDLMAEHMRQFYRSINAFDRTEREGNLLLNAVVAFGADAVELSPPNRMGGRVSAKLEDIPTDPSGLENVMSAIQRALGEYRWERKRRENMMIVIITDESGDDIVHLESVIAQCRAGHVAVHVIGPSAVLGAAQGSQAWKDPVTGHSYLLPVRRGPDTAQPQRPWLPYWHESDLPPWENQGAQIAQGAQWYGGCYRERLISGFGPYALTRLALETGGSFTVLDREADRSRYRLDDLRDYFPDYRSLAEYEASVKRSVLRSTVSRLAAVTMQKKVGAALMPPRMMYQGYRFHRYPFSVVPRYVDPNSFPQQLQGALAAEDRAVAAKQAILMELLAAFELRKVDWEDEYNKEPSPRWRAWFDLTRGRLLATLARCLEYRNACRELPLHLNRGINHVALRDAPNIVVPQSQQLANEAGRLLSRCAKNNPNTPWAELAEWELEKGFGIGYQARVIPPPRPAPAGAMPATVVPSFPSL